MTITPYLLYEDLDAAVDWLVRAFGFTEKLRLTGPDGRSNHAELTLGDGLVMMGRPRDGGFRNPRHLGGVTAQVYVPVADVDAHCAQARSAGAEIIREPADQFYGERTYAAEDPEGHRWSFAQHVREVTPEEVTRGAAAG